MQTLFLMQIQNFKLKFLGTPEISRQDFAYFSIDSYQMFGHVLLDATAFLLSGITIIKPGKLDALLVSSSEIFCN